LRRKNLPVTANTTKAKLSAAATELLHSEFVDDLYLALDSKRLMPKQVIEALVPEIADRKHTRKALPSPKKGIGGVYVDGLDAPANLANCCAPVRGDDIIGYTTRGRGVSVHRVDCPNAKHLINTQSERILNVSWEAPDGEVFPVDFEVIAIDRPALLKDVLDVLEEMNKSATRLSADVQNASSARIYFRTDVKDQNEIEYIKENISRITDVTTVYRSKPGLKA